MKEKLAQLRARLREVDDLKAVYNLLNWDQQTKMPPRGARARGSQIALIARLEHEKFTDPAIGRLLDELEPLEDTAGHDDDASLIRVTRRIYEDAAKVPSEFWSMMFDHSSSTYEAWAVARAENRFELVAEHLEKTLDLSRRLAEYHRPWQHVTDGLTTDREYGTSATEVSRLFGDLVRELVPMVGAIARNPKPDDSFLAQEWPRRQQLDFATEVVKDFGYDFSRGRLDTTRHPFASRLSGSDVRITTRVNENDPRECLFSTFHEAGHAMYEQGVAASLDGTPLGRRGASHGMHESQSRLWENLVGRSRAFWEHRFPMLKDAFPDQLRGVDVERFHAAINAVRPTPVRLFADEVTYNLHIIIRTELENELLEGALAVRDLPDAWNARYEDYLGIRPQSDSDGALQDVHWFGGTIVLPAIIGGAFQGYALGNLIGAQLYDAAVAAHPDIPDEIGQGRFASLHAWLAENVHRHGRKFTAGELLQRATGRPLSTQPYVDYLKHKFGALYDLSA